MLITQSLIHSQAGPQIMPLTVANYHRMIDAGILSSGEPCELLEGALVLKDRSEMGADAMTVGTKHIWVVEKLIHLSSRFEPHGCYIRTQQPVTLAPLSEPEPDGAIVRGSFQDYRERKPVAGDVMAVLEVSDSSLALDRGAKQQIYAGAGITPYLIINLIDDVVEHHSQPQPGERRYARIVTMHRGELLEFKLDHGHVLTLRTDDLLP